MRFEMLHLLDLVLLLVENCQCEWSISFNWAVAVLQRGTTVSAKAAAVKAFAFDSHLISQCVCFIWGQKVSFKPELTSASDLRCYQLFQ